MLLRASPHVAVGDRVIGLAALLAHGEEVREHLGGMPLVGEPVVDGHAGVGGELLDIAVRGAAELDPVVHPAQHARGVGDGLLVAHLRPARIQVRDVGALVVGRHLERRARARGGLLEDQGDLLAGEPRHLGTGVLDRLQSGRQAQEVRELSLREVELLQEGAVAQVVHG
jgi:hypothetical protein